MAFNQMKVHPLSKLWFSDVFNLHPYMEAGAMQRAHAEEAQAGAAAQAAKASERALQAKLAKLPPGSPLRPFVGVTHDPAAVWADRMFSIFS